MHFHFFYFSFESSIDPDQVLSVVILYSGPTLFLTRSRNLYWLWDSSHARIKEFSSGGSRSVWQKSSDNIFFSLVLSLFYRIQMVNFKEIYHFQGSRGGPTFSRGGGPTFSRGGGSNCLFPIETHITCDFPGGGGVRTPCPPLWIRTWAAVIDWLTVVKSTKGVDLRGYGPTGSNTAIWMNIDFILYILCIKIYVHTVLLYSGGPYGRWYVYQSLSLSHENKFKKVSMYFFSGVKFTY